MTTGEKIKKYRKLAGMTQEELGAAIGVQKAAINKYESGLVANVKKHHILSIAKALHISPVDLLDDDIGDFEGLGSDLDTVAAQSRIPPPGVVVPDNALFLRAVEVLSPEDLDTLNGIFARAFEKLNIKEKN